MGLKQGCAALSDLSFVLTKKKIGGDRGGDGGGCAVELGVIAASLQRDEGP